MDQDSSIKKMMRKEGRASNLNLADSPDGSSLENLNFGDEQQKISPNRNIQFTNEDEINAIVSSSAFRHNLDSIPEAP